MLLTSWLQNLRSALAPSRVPRKDGPWGTLRAATHRLNVEALEDRLTPSTFTVTNLLDSGPDSLRAAVASANANPGPDAIDIAATGTITLTSGQLSITDNLSINDPGIDALTVSGGDVDRVFRITGNPTVSIANLIIAHGRAVDQGGGGIYMSGGTLVLNQCTVYANQTENYGGVGGVGGGIFVAGGTLTLDHSTVANNSAFGSDGYYADFGYDGGRGEGGGLYVAYGTVSVNQSNFYGNLAAGGDGRTNYWTADTDGNGGGAAGGGIRIVGGTLGIRQSTFSGNMAVGGSPGWHDYPDSSGTPGVGEGGGLSISSNYDPAAYLDTFTVDHTINNSPDNIVGAYYLDAVPRLTIGDVTVLEGNTGTTSVVFAVSLSAASDQPVTVNYATADGTATAGSDYVAAAGTLTIPAGQMTGTITVLVNGDRLGEPSETFGVNLSSPTNATVSDGQGVGTILDDEPRVSISDVSKKEGNSGLTAFSFTVSLSAPYDVPVTIGYSTTNGTATASSDYQASSGTLTIPAGQTSGTITVQAIGDRLPEPNETFFVNLSNSNYGVVVDGQGVGTILDDEPRISIGDVSKKEGKKGQTTLFTFTVTLSAAYDQAVTMSFRTADGTATTGDSDYTAKTGTLTFAPGETTKTITIEVKGDSKKESDEMFYLDLFGNSTNSLFTKSLGLGTMLNDD